MASSNKIPPVPANEQLLLNASLMNESFRTLLLSPTANRAQISNYLDTLGIDFSDQPSGAKERALNLIERIDWSDLKNLEDVLGRSAGLLGPRMN